MAIKFKGNTVYTLVIDMVTDMMNELDPGVIADFGNGSRIPAYSKFLECYGSVYRDFDSTVADNELGWQYMRYGFNHNGTPYEGLTPPTVAGKNQAEVWLSRFIMVGLSFIRKEMREEVIEQYIDSVPVLIGAAMIAVFNDEKGAVLRRELTRGDKFIDYADPNFNTTAGIRNCDEKKLTELIHEKAKKGDIVSQRIFFVKVIKWMEWMFNQTHPLAQKQARLDAALRQKAIESMSAVMTMAARDRVTMLPTKPDTDYLETVCGDLVDGNAYSEFKGKLLSEIVEEWNCVDYYAAFTPDMLIYNALSNDMIAEDLFTCRHRILGTLGDEAIYTYL